MAGIPGRLQFSALFADSFVDLASSVIAFVGVRMASIPADANHRFGHHKAEAVSSLVQLVLITGSCVFVFIEAVRSLIAPSPLQAVGLGVGVMALSLALTIGLVGFQTFALRKAGSLATESDRAHYIGDMLGNAGALIAIILAGMVGIRWIDGVAGLIVAVFLAVSVISIARRTIPQLMDEELSAEERRRIMRIAEQDAQVHGIHALRTRRAGSVVHIQMHLELDPDMPLRRAHTVSDRVEERVREAFPDADIILHLDPHGVVEPHDAYGHPTHRRTA